MQRESWTPLIVGDRNWFGAWQIKCKRKWSFSLCIDFVSPSLPHTHAHSPVIMTSARCKIITGNCAGWCAGRSENWAIVCRSRMMTNTEKREAACVCARFCTYLYSLWEDLIIGVWTFLENDVIQDGRHLSEGKFLGVKSLCFSVKVRVKVRIWTLIIIFELLS